MTCLKNRPQAYCPSSRPLISTTGIMKKYLPFLAGLSFIAVTVAALEYIALKKTGGHFCYPLDDTFIHMTVSKNLALYGNWGITPTGFVSTSSSPLFTVLLALFFKLFSVNILCRLLSAALVPCCCCWVCNKELNNYTSLSVTNKITCIITSIVCGTLPAMTLLGMEHSLQMAFTLFFVHSIASLLSDTQKNKLWPAVIWAVLMTATRYENVFFIMAAFVPLLAWQKNSKQPLLLLLPAPCPCCCLAFTQNCRVVILYPILYLSKATRILSIS